MLFSVLDFIMIRHQNLIVFDGRAVGRAFADENCRVITALRSKNNMFNEAASRYRPERQWDNTLFSDANLAVLIPELWYHLPKELLVPRIDNDDNNMQNYTVPSRVRAQGTLRLVIATFEFSRCLLNHRFLPVALGAANDGVDDVFPGTPLIVTRLDELIEFFGFHAHSFYDLPEIKKGNITLKIRRIRHCLQVMSQCFATYANLPPWTFNFGVEYEESTITRPIHSTAGRREFFVGRFTQGHNFAANPVPTFCGDVTSGRLMPMIPWIAQMGRDDRAQVFSCLGLQEEMLDLNLTDTEESDD